MDLTEIHERYGPATGQISQRRIGKYDEGSDTVFFGDASAKPPQDFGTLLDNTVYNDFFL